MCLECGPRRAANARRVTCEIDMADDKTIEATANPFLTLIRDDVTARKDWAERDQKICKRRLTERKKVKTKPYKGAPNFVVPIVDDNVREKTDQELTMLLNATRFAHFVQLEAGIDKNALARAQCGFDTFLRHIINIPQKLDYALDMKNCRGYAIIKRVRVKNSFVGLVPDIEIRDPADVLVPAGTRKIEDATRITDVYRFTVDEFDSISASGTYGKWQNVTAVRDTATAAKTGSDKEPDSVFQTIKHLIGINDESEKIVCVFEFWHLASDWTVQKAKEIYGESSRDALDIIKGRRCCMLFSPQAADKPLSIRPWRDPDKTTPTEDRDAPEVRTPGPDRSWPYTQVRYENRSPYFYDTRGIGQLVMDDQIAASATRNAKHVMMDFYQQPQYVGTDRNSGQITHEPGSILPEGISPVQHPAIPPTFDFTTELFKREAAQRVGVVSGYMFSGEMGNKKRVQKTATEVDYEAMRGDMVSSASTERFLGPWTNVFTELWRDLGRLKVDLPIIIGGRYAGQLAEAPDARQPQQQSKPAITLEQIYAWKVLVVPAASSKTLNPDMQFQRTASVWQTCLATLANMGVSFDTQAVAEDLLTNWDPFRAARWIIEPDQSGPGGQQPVYQQIGTLASQVNDMGKILMAVKEAAAAAGKLAADDSQKIDRLVGMLSKAPVAGGAGEEMPV